MYLELYDMILPCKILILTFFISINERIGISRESTLCHGTTEWYIHGTTLSHYFLNFWTWALLVKITLEIYLSHMNGFICVYMREENKLGCTKCGVHLLSLTIEFVTNGDWNKWMRYSLCSIKLGCMLHLSRVKNKS